MESGKTKMSLIVKSDWKDEICPEHNIILKNRKDKK